MRCPCKDCITLPACKHEDLNILAGKCSILKEYLGIINITTQKYETENTVVVTTRLFSKLGYFLNKYRIMKTGRVIPHTFSINEK